jgi:hypothetical protein
MTEPKKPLIKLSRSTNPLAKFTFSAMRILAKWVQLRMLSIRKEGKLVGLIKEIQKERGFSMWPDEMANVFYFALAATKLAGDFAEVGVYRGASAKLICEAKGERAPYTFSTLSKGSRRRVIMTGRSKRVSTRNHWLRFRVILKRADIRIYFSTKDCFRKQQNQWEKRRLPLYILMLTCFRPRSTLLNFFIHEWRGQESSYRTISQLHSAFAKLFMIILQISRSPFSNSERASVLL